MKTAQPAPKNIDEYIADFPPTVRTVLRRVRSTIRKALPGAEEVISYRIPAFRVHGSTVLYFAGWKKHYSLYPSTDRLVKAFKDELAPYEVNNKGTIRFPSSKPLPAALVRKLVRARIAEITKTIRPKCKK